MLPSLRIKLALLFGAAVAAVAVAALAPAGALASGWGFSVRPATFNPRVPATRAYFKPTIQAGGTYTGAVVVTNLQSTPVHALVYPVDGLTAVTGGAVYGNQGSPLRGAGRWMTPAVSSLTLPAGRSERVPFTVKVPASAVPGDHLAGLAIQNADPIRSHGRRLAIIEVFRAVVGVEVLVPGPARAALHLTGAWVRSLPGTKLASIVVGLRNAGGLLCKPQLDVSLKGRGVARTVSRQMDTVLPDSAIDFPLPWPYTLASGDYGVAVKATGCGAPTMLSSSVSLGGHLTGTDRSAPPQMPRAEPARMGWVAWVLAGVLALLALGALGRALLRRVRRRPLPAGKGLALLERLLQSDGARPVSVLMITGELRHRRAIAAAVRTRLRDGDRICTLGNGRLLIICPVTTRLAATLLQEDLYAHLARHRRLADVPIEIGRATANKPTTTGKLLKRIGVGAEPQPIRLAPLEAGETADAR